MPVVAPSTKPRLSSADLHQRIAPFQLDRKKYPLVLVGIRGYYKNTMGKPGVNDRGIYDDALFIDTPHVTASFNANTDPSFYRKGKGTGSGKGMAKLQPGLWLSYGFGLHKGYQAIVQTGKVTVLRDGDPDYEDSGYFGINIHRGGNTTTGSEGCQTIYPLQWQSFIQLAKDQVVRLFGARWNKVTLPYVLVEE